MTNVIGIDLGTTNTVVATVRDGHATALADEAGRTLIPSVVSFAPDGQVLVGQAAKERRTLDPENTIYSVKRLIGRSAESEEFRAARARFPFELREGPGQAALVVARGATYTLPEISAFVLRKARAIAEAALSTSVERAVITVPANFNDLQRAATKVAGRVAGLEVLRILNEPTAAALAYGFGRASSERVAVYDFGGGTFDVTLLDLSDNVFEVLATAGNTFLGGDDIDLAIADRMVQAFYARHRQDLRQSPSALAKLRAASERIKHVLSVQSEAAVSIPELATGSLGRSLGLEFKLTRAEFDVLAAPIIERTFDVCNDALALARLSPTDFGEVLLVGGSTRVPLVRERVEAFFRRPIQATISPDEVVGLGAAIQAHALAGGAQRRATLPMPPVTSRRPQTAPSAPAAPPGPAPQRPITLSALEVEQILSAPAAWEQPAAKPPPPPPRTQRLHRAPSQPPAARAVEPSPPPPSTPPSTQRVRSVAPPPPLLIDVTPLSLCVETVNGFCDPVIARNTPVPCEQTRDFVTARDGQTVVHVRVAQGESRVFEQNTLLGEVELSNLTPGPRGTLQIAVTFALDANGMLNVSAQEKATGKSTTAELRLIGLPNAGELARLTAQHASQGTPPRS